MYELTIRVVKEIMEQTDFHKYTIQEIQEMKAILEQFKDQTIELELYRIKEVQNGQRKYR